MQCKSFFAFVQSFVQNGSRIDLQDQLSIFLTTFEEDMVSKSQKSGMSRRDLLFGGFRKMRKNVEKNIEDFQTIPDSVSSDEAQTGRDAFVLGNTAYAAAQYAEAIPHYRECLNILPQHTEARQRLGYCLYREGQYIQAKVEFERVIRERKKDNFSSLYLGLTYARLDKREKTVAAWRGYFNPEEVRIMRELNVQTALIESAEDYELSVAASDVEDAIDIRKQELLAPQDN